MPISNEIVELSYQTLKHFCEIAPYSSCNLAWGLKEKPEKNIYKNSAAYCNWFKTACSEETQIRWQNDSNTICEKKRELNEAAPFFHYFQNFFYELGAELYEMVRRTKTGTCGDLASAGAYYLISHLKYLGTLRVFIGLGQSNNEHCFIVFNCPDTIETKDGRIISINEKELIHINQLPDSCLILDLWIRCSFSPSKAPIFWAYMMDIFDTKEFFVKQIAYMNGNQFHSDLPDTPAPPLPIIL